MKSSIALGLGLALGCAGCAGGINVTHVTDTTTPATGNPWNLAMTQFNLAITREVTGCGRQLAGKVEVTVTPAKAPDSQQRYVLYSDGVWSTSDITSNLALDGTSTGLNAQSAGQGAAVISSVVGTVGSIAVLAGSGAPGADTKGPTQICTTAVATAVAEMYPGGDNKTLADTVTADTTTLTAATADVTSLTAQSQADATLKPKLATAIAAQTAAQKQLTTDQAKLTKDLKLTTSVQNVSWPYQASQFREDTAFSIDQSVSDPVNKKTAWVTNAADRTAFVQFDVYLALYWQGSDGSWSLPTESPSNDTSIGVPVRTARTGRLLVCTIQQCPPSLAPGWVPPPDDPESTESKITFTDQPVLQIGQMYTVPVTGGAFKSENAVIALDSATGLPTSIETTEKTSEAATIAGAVQNGVSQIAALPGQINTSKLTALQAQTNIATTKGSLLTADANAAEQGQISALSAQTALDQAQTANISASNALAAAKASVP